VEWTGHVFEEAMMSRWKFATFISPFVIFCVSACADRSPVAPNVPVDAAGDVSARPSETPGRYELSFYDDRIGGWVPVSSLPVLSDELILAAHVTTDSGIAATSGSVTFEYCSYKGLPPNDITRADEAPLEACANGSANWARLTAIGLSGPGCPQLGPGYACMDFGIVHLPRKIGFRFRFSGQKSGVASGVSVPQNFEWTAQ